MTSQLETSSGGMRQALVSNRFGVPMSHPHVSAITAFVPAKDFAVSKQFYLDLGFQITWGGVDACGLQIDGHGIILQNFSGTSPSVRSRDGRFVATRIAVRLPGCSSRTS